MQNDSGHNTIIELVERALEIGADQLDIEYNGGVEEVAAFQGNVGVGIANLEASSREAEALREQLYALARKGRTVVVKGVRYRLRASEYDSFGETAYRVSITPI